MAQAQTQHRLVIGIGIGFAVICLISLWLFVRQQSSYMSQLQSYSDERHSHQQQEYNNNHRQKNHHEMYNREEYSNYHQRKNSNGRPEDWNHHHDDRIHDQSRQDQYSKNAKPSGGGPLRSTNRDKQQRQHHILSDTPIAIPKPDTQRVEQLKLEKLHDLEVALQHQKDSGAGDTPILHHDETPQEQVEHILEDHAKDSMDAKRKIDQIVHQFEAVKGQ